MERPASATHGLKGLAGKTCIVTGASQGIGAATVHELAQHGARVVVTSRSASRARALAKTVGDTHGCEALGIELDVTSTSSVSRGVDRALAWGEGSVPVLVNNAGLPVVDELWNTAFDAMPLEKLAEWFSKVHEIDVAGSRNMTRALLPSMVDNREGSIVFLSSTPALAGHHATPYTEAKAALLGLMRDVAVNYAPFNVRSNAVAPGNIRTSWFDKNSASEQQALRDESPMKRWGDPEEVARVIAFFASPQSSFVTGQTLVIDGGKVIH